MLTHTYTHAYGGMHRHPLIVFLLRFWFAIVVSATPSACHSHRSSILHYSSIKTTTQNPISHNPWQQRYTTLNQRNQTSMRVHTLQIAKIFAVKKVSQRLFVFIAIVQAKALFSFCPFVIIADWKVFVLSQKKISNYFVPLLFAQTVTVIFFLYFCTALKLLLTKSAGIQICHMRLHSLSAESRYYPAGLSSIVCISI